MIGKRFDAFVVVIGLLGAHSSDAQTSRSAEREWIERWDIRYVLFIDTDWSMRTTIKVAKKINEERSRAGDTLYFAVEGLFQPTEVDAGNGEKFATVLLRFDDKGRVLNSTAQLRQFQGKRNVLGHLVLVKDPNSKEIAFAVADWSQGVPGSTAFSPAVCSTIDRSFRYGRDWKSGNFRGDVGCREWTAQLYDSDRPYIDITTYDKNENFIGEIVGWSRFGDPPKPVIGQHGKTWLCLHECPNGEKPGVIKDIAAWTRKHGFPMPVRPAKQPEYPDADINWDD